MTLIVNVLGIPSQWQKFENMAAQKNHTHKLWLTDLALMPRYLIKKLNNHLGKQETIFQEFVWVFSADISSLHNSESSILFTCWYCHCFPVPSPCLPGPAFFPSGSIPPWYFGGTFPCNSISLMYWGAVFPYSLLRLFPCGGPWTSNIGELWLPPSCLNLCCRK